MERWLPVVGFEGRYEVSDCGNVRSLVDNARNRRQLPKMLKPRRGRGGYSQVALYTAGRRIPSNRMAHRLVLEAFVGPCPEGMEAAHNDGNPQNNHVSNLRWCTHRDNWLDQLKQGNFVVGEGRTISKLKEPQVREIRKLYATGEYSYCKLGQMFGVDAKTIWSLIKGDSWKHVA